MATSRDDIFKNALSLEDADRADLIAVLIHSLDSHVEEGVEEAWRIEIERRSRELESGAVESIPWEVVRERLVRAPRGQAENPLSSGGGGRSIVGAGLVLRKKRRCFRCVPRRA